MINITSEVCSEVYDIIQHMDEELRNKISIDFINVIKQKMNENFIVDIDYSKRIDEQELQNGTRIVLSLIYRDYLCSEEQKRELIEKDVKELSEKYDINRIIKEKSEKNKKTEIAMVIHKETIIRKLLKIFKKKK